MTTQDVNFREKRAMTMEDVEVLVDLVTADAVLVSKETNAATNLMKEQSWRKLCEKFNSKTLSQRTITQLKAKWDNLKKNARKRAQQIRANCLKTGGGKPDFIPQDMVLDKVAGILGATCTGFEVPFGGDGQGIDMIDENENWTESATANSTIELHEDNFEYIEETPGRVEEPASTSRPRLYGMQQISKPLLSLKGVY